MRDEIFKVPDWFLNAVIYNVFPDSFSNGKRNLTETERTFTDGEGKPHRSMHGGTIRGVIENLDYIKDLGFNTVYLNPIFAAGEYHKYDIMDYFHIDPVLGTDEDFLELTDKVHELGMHIIIDGVFNHCGWQHPIFEDVIKKGEASEFKDFFYGLRFPVRKPGPGERPTYDCFAYEKRMPKLNTANPKVQEYFAKVGAYWVEKFHIDGWRLDVANEIDKNFWRVFRKAVTAADPEAVLIGEVWEDATDWIEYDKMHSSMNYEFRRSCLEGIAQSEKTAGEFGDSLVSMYLRYSEPKAKAQMNLLDSHDVPRFLSLCDGDIKKMKAALATLFFFPGVPCMFYGDEFAIEGVKEHEYRMSPPWGEEPKLGGFIKELLKVRKEKLSPASSWARIETGEKESVFGFERLQKEPLKVYINTGSEVCDVSELVSEGKVLYSEGLCEGKLESFGFAILSC